MEEEEEEARELPFSPSGMDISGSAAESGYAVE